MRHFSIVLAMMYGLLTACATVPVTQGAANPEGRWAVRLEGRPVIIVDLHHSNAAPGGWSGSFAVAQFTMDDDHSFSNVRGPSFERPIVWSASDGRGTVQFRVNPDRETYVFTAQGNGTAILGWKSRPAEPLVLSAARSDETIADSWDSGKVFKAEDGHR